MGAPARAILAWVLIGSAGAWALDARAQDDDEGALGDEGDREEHDTPLSGIVPGLVLHATTTFLMGDDYETDLELRWRDASGERSQDLLEPGSLGSISARGYRAAVVRGGVEIECSSGNRYSDAGETTRERWELADGRFVQRWSRTTSPNQEGLGRMNAALDRGDFAAARRIAGTLEASPNGGHTDQAGAVFQRFLRATHRVAMGEIRRRPAAAAARFVALFDDPPMESSEVGVSARGWCIQDRLASCPEDPALTVTRDARPLLRIFNDVGDVYAEAGLFARAAEILTQVVEVDGDRAAARLNLADALWGLGRHEEARAHYRAYVRLRSSASGPRSPRAPPARVTERLSTAP